MVEIILPPPSFTISVASPHSSDCGPGNGFAGGCGPGGFGFIIGLGSGFGFSGGKGCGSLRSLVVFVAEIAASSEAGDGVD